MVRKKIELVVGLVIGFVVGLAIAAFADFGYYFTIAQILTQPKDVQVLYATGARDMLAAIVDTDSKVDYRLVFCLDATRHARSREEFGAWVAEQWRTRVNVSPTNMGAAKAMLMDACN